MRIKVKYPTKERKYLNEFAYQNVYKEAELEAFRFLRYPCGSGAAANRFHYQVDVFAPEDAEFVNGGMIRCNIVRKENPHFDPKKIVWLDNIGFTNPMVKENF